MNFTTTTEIARKWSKIFWDITYATVLNNNTDIGMIIWKDMYKLMLEKWVLDDLIEELEMRQNKDNLKKKYTESLNSGLSNLVI
jgi:hypothetical protein